MEAFNGYTDSLKQFNVANLRLSTSFRSNFYDRDTNCTINLTQNRIINNVVKINLNSVTICNNFYNVASYNNKFNLDVINADVPTNYDIVVPPGYYNTTELAAILQELIRVHSAFVTVAWSDTYKRFYVNSGSPVVKIRFFTPNPPPKNFLQNNFLYLVGLPVLGFPYEADDTNVLFPNPPALFGATNVYIMSNKLVSGKSVLNVLGPNDADTDRDLQSQNGSEIMSLGITSAYGAYQTYYDQGSDRGDYVLSQGIALDSIDLKVVDEFGNVLETDANNTPIYFSFKVSYQ
jgi:hypothetical protein